MDSIDKTIRDRFFVIVVFTLVLIMALRLPFDTDFWWHIRAGKDTVLLGKPILTDLYSFTRYGVDWVNHSWLGQVILYLIYDLFSIPGVMLFVTLAAAGSVFFVYKTMHGPVLLKGFILVLMVMISAVIWTPRPQLFSFLFLALEQYLLYQFQATSNKRLLIGLFFLFLVWSNVHAGFSLGILLLILWLLGAVIDKMMNQETTAVIDKNEYYLFGVLVLSSLIVMLNPNGVNVWRVQFDTISVSVLQDLIPEWASPNFHELYQQPFLWAWLLVVFFGLAAPGRIQSSKILLVLIFGYLGFLAKRNYGPFAIVVTPVLSELITIFYATRVKNSYFLKRIKKMTETPSKPVHPTLKMSLNLFIFFILVLVLFGKYVYLSNFITVNYYEEKLFPKEAVIWLEKNPIPGNGLNEYAWGGYMLWYLPETRVFVDGRTDLYGDKIILDWLNSVSGTDQWDEKLTAYDIQWVFLEKNRPLNLLLLNQNWSLMYEDEMAIILRSP